MQKKVERGQAPKSVDRVDKGKGSFEHDHIHFKDGSALNRDGSWKHNPKDHKLVEKERKFLNDNGWAVPE